MAEESYFLTKTETQRGDMLSIGGAPVIERYETLKAAVTKVAGLETAGLFAEPVFSHGNDAAPASISWYTSYNGEARRLTSLDAGTRANAEEVLRTRLLSVADGLKDPDLGPLLGSALHIKSLDDVYMVGARPVLANWAMVPDGASLTRKDRNAHFAVTTGRYLLFDEAPAITSEEWRGRLSDVAAALSAAAATPVSAQTAQSTAMDQQKQAGQTLSETGGGANQTVVSAEERTSAWRWTPLAVLLAIMTIFLIWLLIPGTLLYPAQPVAAISNDEALNALEDSNAALLERRDALRDALEGAVCTADGSLFLPDGELRRRPDGTLLLPLPPVGEPVETPETVEGRADALLPPDPSRLRVLQEGGDPASLVNYIEERTTLVLVQGAGSEGGSGSGFFISPELVVTNHHVITGAGQSPQVYVMNDRLGRLTPAEVIAASGPMETNGDDFAVLRVAGANMPFFPVLQTSDSLKLQNVVAAGFPASFMQNDANWQALINGRASATPDVVMTEGKVESEQNFGGRSLTLIHGANISSGNSGGPLIDSCGRVVGVNTFGVRDDNTQRFLNYSLHSTELLTFLGSANASPQIAQGSCRPQVAPQQNPPRIAAAEDEADTDRAQPDQQPPAQE